jgi:type I restriction enzyme R subunit
MGPGITATTTIQKFQDAAASRGAVLNEAPNVFVLVDEAHRTQYKSLAANMRKALPNACFLGFTGTPIDKQDRSTPRVFGPYIHKYPIRQSVEDGATVPIYYESRLPDLRVEGLTLDAVFERVFKDLGTRERGELRKKYATLEAIASSPQRIEMVCRDLIEHYEKYIRPNGLKAQVVACSREAAATYHETLERLKAPETALFISVGHNDVARLAIHRKTKEQRDKVIDRFKDKNDPLSILVVCDMLLTGFDAPVEQVMYLDSPLREHNLLQAIARVNRPFDEKKTYGLVVDYWGVSADLQDALAIFEPQDVAEAMTERNDELPRLEHRHRQVMRFFEKVNRDDLEACLKVIEPEDRRGEFEIVFRRFSQSLDMVLPDPAGLKFTADLKWLGKLRAVAKARFRDGTLDLSGYGAKVRRLIEEHIRAERIVPLLEPVSVFSERFDEHVASLKSAEAKASEMEHALRHEITIRLDEDPVFYGRLSEQLEAIIQERRNARIKDTEVLKRLSNVLGEARGREQKARDLGLTEDGLALYNLLTAGEGGPGGGAVFAGEPATTYASPSTDPRAVTEDILASLKQLAVIDWVQKDDVQREMRREIKRRLRGARCDEERMESLTSRIMDLARARMVRS